MLECYRRKMLRVDLTTRGVREEALSEEFLSEYVGGMGFGVKLVTDEVPPQADPLGPQNKLVISVGPLTSTHAPMHAQACLVGKSPLTNGIINSYAGGYVGGAIRACAYDAIVIEGKADQLVYLLITPEGVRIVDCPELAGGGTSQTEAAVVEAYGNRDMSVLSIGMGGENMVRFASVMSGTRAFGRGGLGAVLGSKNLKAVGIHGNTDIEVADPEAFDAAVGQLRASLKETLSNQWSLLTMFGRQGTGCGMQQNNEKYSLATMNHLRCQFDGVAEIDASAFMTKYPTRPIACLGCVVHCGMLRSMGKPTKYGDTWGRGPEYETTYSMGSLCGVADSDAVLRSNLLCEKYGLDTLSAGVTVAFAMECAQRGIIPPDVLGDVPLEFGNGEAEMKLIEMIGCREGIGDLLAEGTKRAAQKLGQGSEEFALCVKGMEFAAWMPERMRGIALAFATANRGACHKRAIIGDELFRLPMDSIEGKAAMTKDIQDKVNGMFTLISCRFAEFGIPLSVFTAMLSAATGIERSPEWLVGLGEKLWNMERLFNLRAGMTAADDMLPERCFEPLAGLPVGTIPLDKEIFRALLAEYYQVRGWDENGVPTEEKLRSLGIPAA